MLSQAIIRRADLMRSDEAIGCHKSPLFRRPVLRRQYGTGLGVPRPAALELRRPSLAARFGRRCGDTCSAIADALFAQCDVVDPRDEARVGLLIVVPAEGEALEDFGDFRLLEVPRALAERDVLHLLAVDEEAVGLRRGVHVP